VDAKITQRSPEIDSFVPVHLQASDRCSANWRDAYDFGKVLAPEEMCLPLVRSWVEK
jgi:hypothetical protein